MAARPQGHDEYGRRLGMGRKISRRDFVEGAAVAVGGAALAGALPNVPAWAAERTPHGGPTRPYRETGLRGQYEGSYDVPHAVRDGRFDPGRVRDTGEEYDLVVVGGGISGLAAAYFYRQTRPGARVLVLENLDDFGGHAKRNEFVVRGERLIGYGGSQSIDSPDTFEPQTREFLHDIGVRYEPFYEHFDRDFYDGYGLGEATFFNAETFGKDQLVVRRAGESAADYIGRFPLSREARDGLVRLHTTTEDFLPGLSDAEKKQRLLRMSYLDYVRRYIGLTGEAVEVIRDTTEGMWGLGIDAISALDAWGIGRPGFAGLALTREYLPAMAKSCQRYIETRLPYIFHYPDGNGGLARLIARALVPEVIPGSTQESAVLAKTHYALLDRPHNQVRVRLNSTCVRIEQTRGHAETIYTRERKTYRVRSRHVVVGCWNSMAAYLVDGLSTEQREALRYSVKVPLIYTNVALRNWEPMVEIGARGVETPGMYWHGFSLDAPVSMGGYEFSQDPTQPIVLHLSSAPTTPGLSAKDQFRRGRGMLLDTPFTQLEFWIRDTLARALGDTDFDPARDIEAITVNRWSHGYAYELMSLWDEAAFRPEAERPYARARQRFGRVAFANSDSQGTAYADAAIDEAYRAVQDLVS